MFVLGRGLFAFALIALWIYCIFDVIRTEESTVQNLPKMFWLMIVIFLPDIGSIAWLLLGRPPKGTWDLRGPQRSKPSTASGPPTGLPEDRPAIPDFEARRQEALKRYMSEREEELKKREEEIQRLEEEFRKKNDDDSTPNN